VELEIGLETDTGEIAKECIESVKNYGRVGVSGLYVDYTNHSNVDSRFSAPPCEGSPKLKEY
jgi:hypothetical protein